MMMTKRIAKPPSEAWMEGSPGKHTKLRSTVWLNHLAVCYAEGVAYTRIKVTELGLSPAG